MIPIMDRFWLLTWTCYGTWLPGDPRGFVGNVREEDGSRAVHNLPGTPYDEDLPLLEAWASQQLRGEPVTLGSQEADAMIAQYQQTAQIREWRLQAASVMFNHTHLVVGVPGDPDPQYLLETFKSWATRALKKLRPPPSSGRFWTAKGSKRKLADETAILAAVVYVVKKQSSPLATFNAERWQETLDAWNGEGE